MTQLPYDLLRDRLNHVRRLLPLAAKHAEEDCEYVHHLRIATRESIAALDAYAEVLPAKETRSLRKRLNRIRSAASDARDLDVMLADYRDSKTAGRKKLIRQLSRKRNRAQRPLVKIHKRCKRDQRFVSSVDACLQEIQSVPSDQINATITNRVMAVAQSLYEAAPEADCNAAMLHRFRVKAKHLRYCLELFGQTNTDETTSDLYAMACKIQKKLGVMNDHIVAGKHLRRARKDGDSKRFVRRMKRNSKHERTQAQEARRDFWTWWNAGQHARMKRLCETQVITAPTSQVPAS